MVGTDVAFCVPRELDRRRAGGEHHIRTNFLAESGSLWRCLDLRVMGGRDSHVLGTRLLTSLARAGGLEDFSRMSPSGTLWGCLRPPTSLFVSACSSSVTGLSA